MHGVELGHLPNRRFDLVSGGTVDLGASTSVHVHVDEARCNQSVSQLDDGEEVLRRGALAHLAHGAALHDNEAVV
jgi:hypothetical protein